MKKEDLEMYKELHETIEEKALQIAEMKNKYSKNPFKYDYSEISYDCGEWEVSLIQRVYCSCCSDDSTWYNVTEEEMLSEFDELEEKLKGDYDLRIEKQQKEEELKKQKDKEDKEKRELDLYNQLKNKFENK